MILIVCCANSTLILNIFLTGMHNKWLIFSSLLREKGKLQMLNQAAVILKEKLNNRLCCRTALICGSPRVVFLVMNMKSEEVWLLWGGRV